MMVAGVLLCLMALGVYALLLRTTNQLVREVNEADAKVSFSWYRWNKAWRPHRALFPASTLRRDLILRVALCFFLMAAGVLCVGIARIHQNGWPGR
jgi:hypothetical protein